MTGLKKKGNNFIACDYFYTPKGGNPLMSKILTNDIQIFLPQLTFYYNGETTLFKCMSYTSRSGDL